MTNNQLEMLAIVDQAGIDLQNLINQLQRTNTITDGDADDLMFRAEIITAELRACIESSIDNSQSGSLDEW
jgi:hypothetical protein